jgi:chromosome partitioning protein
MKIITIANFKGGAGKTTVALNLAVQLHAAGRRVLCVDIDSNNNLTDFLLRDVTTETIDSANLLHVFRGAALAECIHVSHAGPDVLPATIALSELTKEIGENFSRLLMLRPLLQNAGYDYVIMDSPPYRGVELLAALWNADLVLSPVAPRRWIFQGTQFLKNDMTEATRFRGAEPELWLVSVMAGKSERDRARLAALGEQYPFTKTVIPRLEGIATAADAGRVLKPGTIAADTFRTLAEEVLQWGGERRRKTRRTG